MFSLDTCFIVKTVAGGCPSLYREDTLTVCVGLSSTFPNAACLRVVNTFNVLNDTFLQEVGKSRRSGSQSAITRHELPSKTEVKTAMTVAVVALGVNATE